MFITAKPVSGWDDGAPSGRSIRTSEHPGGAQEQHPAGFDQHQGLFIIEIL